MPPKGSKKPKPPQQKPKPPQQKSKKAKPKPKPPSNQPRKDNPPANTQAGASSSIPRSKGICRAFVQRNCARGASCRFSHDVVQNNATSQGGGVRQGNAAPQIEIHKADNETEASRGQGYEMSVPQPYYPPSKFPGLTNDQFSVGGTDASPAQTNQSLKLYVNNTSQFRIPEQVYKFVELLCNANTRNTSWTPEDGQALLRDMVKGNGILRLGEAIRFPTETDRTWSFQRGYIPIFTYLSSEWVIKSTMNSDVNALYGLVHNELSVICATVETHMRRLMEGRSFNEDNKPLSGKQVFKVLFVTLFEYLTRFKQATTQNPGICGLVEQIAHWFEDWVASLESIPPFDDECAGYETLKKGHIIQNLRHNKDQVLRVIRRTRIRIVQPEEHVVQRGSATEALAARLQSSFKYDRPGGAREQGPRHDNDHELIEYIRVAPTHAELLCEDEPFLPGNFLEAPHFYPSASVERLLDIQFRLLREELTAPLRIAVQDVVSDLKKPTLANTPLSKLISDGGGRYPTVPGAQDSVLFSVFTNVTFHTLSVNNRGTSVGMAFDAPPGQARKTNPEERKEYWERVTKKHLMQDGLVALVWKGSAGKIDIYIGRVASTPEDLIASARRNKDRVSINVSFLDAAPELRVLRILQNRVNGYGTVILIEAPVLYESIRPFLEALKRDPETLPFSRYLRLQSREELARTAVAPPLYSLTPGFSFQLKDLFDSSANVPSVRMITHSSYSVTAARAQLAQSSRLDPSQADAVVSSLTQEISLIQGPPGTGKSYTGLELIRVLIKNNISPILLVAYTNHALDHMLNGVLKNEITENIVRIGSRFRMDEKLARFSLDEAVMDQPKSKLDQEVGAAFSSMKSAESEIRKLMKWIATRQVPPDEMIGYIQTAYRSHHQELMHRAPSWVLAVAEQYGVFGKGKGTENEGWQIAGKVQKYSSLIEFWVAGQDLQFLEGPKNTKIGGERGEKIKISSFNPFSTLGSKDGEVMNRFGLEESLNSEPSIDPREELLQFLRPHGVNAIPNIPSTTRSFQVLRNDSNVWSMSLVERKNLHDGWSIAANESLRPRQVTDFERLRVAHARARTRFEERKDQSRVNILKRAHIIGCTTTGAAKIISLLSSVEPKVMIVEEAGQVLESHILASLVESVQQVIMIGDPLQLRPNVNSYKLSMDNPSTGKIYRFDQSLMERLSSSGFPMAQLTIQRRMRPEISSLIRNTLYRGLRDHSVVSEYPHVRGMSQDLYFISHTNKESGGGDDSVSKYNQYEVDMIYDLVLHLLRQGCYNNEGDIVVLAAYLGQIPRIRQKLSGVVATLVDERDAALLEERGIESGDDPNVQEVEVTQRVIIRTLDNFQGEEGTVIILSLVRNSGTPFDGKLESLQYGGRSPIGFLRSTNRTNVGLSRAKHGLYIFGNAPELARGSQMWTTVLRELHTSRYGGIGKGFRMSCHNHPEYEQWIDRPGALKEEGAEEIAGRTLFVGTSALLSVMRMTPTISPLNAKSHAYDFVQSYTRAIVNVGSARKRQ